MVRIHVWLAKQIDISRRKAEKLVQEQQVLVDNKVAEVGQIVQGSENIMVEGRRVYPSQVDTQIIALHKPTGYACSRVSQNGQRSVFELLPPLSAGKWVLVGRLDINTSGLLLATTNGTLANTLAHPSRGFQREYLVRVSDFLTDVQIRQLKKGVALKEGMARVKSIASHGKATKGRNAWYRMTLLEGRNRMVRRLMEEMGVQVSRLIRIRFGPIKLEKQLGQGKFQKIDYQWLKNHLTQ